MKRVSILLAALVLSLSASELYLTQDFVTDNITLKQGVALTKKANSYELEGFIKKGSSTLYFDKTLRLELGSVKKGAFKTLENQNGLMKVLVNPKPKASFLASDSFDAWEEAEDIFLEKCSQCHGAPEVSSHTMLEWEGLYASMKGFAQPSMEEEKSILFYLKSFSKDGMIKESE